MWIRKSSLMISVCLIILFSMQVPPVNGVIETNQGIYSEDRALRKIIDDPEGDINNITDIERDLLGAWVGDDNDYLFFAVQFDAMAQNSAYVNMTLRTETGELFLIMASVTDSGSLLILTHATSLVDNGLNTGEDCLWVEYTFSGRVRMDATSFEMYFYIDWQYLGRAHQEVALVFWTGLVTYPEYDKMPNQGFVTYTPDIADKNVNYQFDPNESPYVVDVDSNYCNTAFFDGYKAETVTVTVTDMQNGSYENFTADLFLPLNSVSVFSAIFLSGILALYRRKISRH